jgi:aerobic-type carbon monoxide dehydrogenase small subunit (CoxS/CutS family)
MAVWSILFDFRCRVPAAVRVQTIEGLAVNGELHPVQKAFIECGGVQCGFCTPGMIMASKTLLDSIPKPDGGADSASARRQSWHAASATPRLSMRQRVLPLASWPRNEDNKVRKWMPW